MLLEFLSPGSFLTFLGRDSAPHSTAATHDAEPENPGQSPSRTIAELRLDALESLNDTELARLGLSRGVLALRAGCPDRV